MSSRSALWRSIGSTKQHLQKQADASNVLPRKFMPSRDRSESVDKIFDLSRMRMNSSFGERSTLNVSNQNQKVIKQKTPSKKLVNFTKMNSQVKQPLLQQNSINQSILKSNTILKVVRGTDSNQGISSLRREFLLFKQNVLQELQRQKEIVNKIVKEIILTMEFQLQKLGKTISSQLYQMKPIQEFNSETFKSIENWKQSLQQTNLSSRDSKNQTENSCFKLINLKNKEIYNSTKESQIGPPLAPVDFSEFLSGLNKLRNQMNQMQKICEQKDREIQLQLKNIR